ncbi:MAG: bifunctional adenosylcobinamide kinase/adenosylcobinamide-phosphate guanylyltransferase [Nitrospirales bacterium]|nr:bifunctional adenosylcobinamide kinase/adenosylcobinamide-phosphate guanylyltransferase [Nitrospirales bacterium]
MKQKCEAPNHMQLTKLIFVLGGASSGKSAYALNLCEASTPRAFLATGEPLDAEMSRRIHAHQKARGKTWETIEIPLHVADWFEQEGHRYAAVLLDCLTLWLSNLQRDGVRTRQVLTRTKALLRAVRWVSGRVVIVSNELGLGLVPGDLVSRQFRTVAGQMNQLVAAAADEVHLVVSGLPLRLK